jgi:hypothetical protein
MSPAEVKQAIARNRRAAMAMQNFAQRQATAASGEIPRLACCSKPDHRSVLGYFFNLLRSLVNLDC